MEKFFICLGTIAVIMIAMTPFVILDIRKLRRKVEEVFAGRQKLNEREFFENYFEQKGIPFFVVQKIRKIFEEELGSDLSGLSAEDDFSKNLSFFWEYDSLVDVELVMRIEEEFDIKISDEEAPTIYRSVDEIVSFVWQKVREKNEGAS